MMVSDCSFSLLFQAYLCAARPCQRCVKRSLQDSCTDGVRKKAKYLLDDEELGMSACTTEARGLMSCRTTTNQASGQKSRTEVNLCLFRFQSTYNAATRTLLLLCTNSPPSRLSTSSRISIPPKRISIPNSHVHARPNSTEHHVPIRQRSSKHGILHPL